uniref:Uncharacterized protein n=1 Tax=Fagus sylvatica TaxID=28930 RepID=A0A2N9F2G8_FAGSY
MDRMASEGSSWHQVRSEELPSGLSVREDGGNYTDETPSISDSSRGDGIPNPNERVCSSKYDDVAFYEVDFNADLRFPLQPFMKELLDCLRLSPGQLAPNAWRTAISCMVLWRICSKGADSLTVDEFLYCYKPYQIAVSPGFWTLNNHQKGMKLVTGLLTSNREWKDDYGTSFAARMATAKLNKEKLKRMIEQKDAVPVNLSKKRRGDLASKPASDEVVICPMAVPESASVVHVLASLIKVVEPTKVPSSSRVIEKAPTLALDASLALRQAKSVVTKEDMDDNYGFDGGYGRRQPVHAMGGGHCEVEIAVDGCHGRQPNPVIYRSGANPARAVEEYKSSDACDENNTKYFLASFELLRKQAKAKYPDLDFDVFQPYEDDDFVAPVEEGDGAVALTNP